MKIYARLSILCVLLLVLLSGCRNPEKEMVFDYPFWDHRQNFETRVENLISLLSLEEKTGLLMYNSPSIDRLGIPEYIWWNECLHGVGRAGKATVFPQAIGLAATFDNELIFSVASAISDEARAKNQLALKKGNREQYTGLTFWTPNINIFRDPRWGRGQETYGEDVYLTSVLGTAFVKGLQGDHPKYLKAAACAKHFAVHSGPEKTRHEVDIQPDERDLREIYLPAFKALVDSGVESVMCAYNRLYGSPCCGSNFLLDSVLRKEWGFKGHIVTDCWALMDIVNGHKIVKTDTEAAAMAANAGVNLNCGVAFKKLKEAVELGFISETKIDSLLRPVLMTRFKLGMFDKPELVPFTKIPKEVINSQQHRELAYKAALKSMVLLQNNNKTLPLDLKKLKKIMVTGPIAGNLEALMGNYNGFSGNMVSFLEGIINRTDGGTVVEYSPGCLLAGENLFHGFWSAESADIVIAVMGLNHLLEGEDGDAMLNKNGGDRIDLKLPENQLEFLRQMRKTIGQKTMIVIVTGGSAIDLSEVATLADAIIFAWYPGEEGGNAAADLIFGNANPSGKLPVTFYRSVEDLPPFNDYSMKGRTYKYFRGKPLYPFGFGLGYSVFGIREFTMDKKLYRLADKNAIGCILQNKGEYDGEEVLQVYAVKPEAGMNEPRKTLIGFKRVFVEKGREKPVQVPVDFNQLKRWDPLSSKYIFENGKYLIEIGSSSENILASKEIVIQE